MQAYIEAMPGWKRAVGRRIDRLVMDVVPEVCKAVRWHTPFFGVADQGWFMAMYCYAKYVQVTFFRGAKLRPVPPKASKQADVRYYEIREHDELDDDRLADWIRQASQLPGEKVFEMSAATASNAGSRRRGSSRRRTGERMSEQSSKVDAFVRRAKRWPDEIAKLRAVLLECGLDEDIKWGKPCFMHRGRNVAIIQPFKDHCALMFFKGALLKDDRGLLRSQGANTQSAMRLEFTSSAQIKKTVVTGDVKQAIAVEKAGLAVDFKARTKLELPEELTRAFAAKPKLAKAFAALTPGRQRGYVLHFTGAKQTKTRAARVERCAPRILAGKGFNER